MYLLLLLSTASAADVTVTLANRLAVDIDAVEVSAASENAWSAVGSVSGDLDVGGTASFEIATGIWDVRLLNDAGEEILIVRSVDLRASKTLTLTDWPAAPPPNWSVARGALGNRAEDQDGASHHSRALSATIEASTLAQKVLNLYSRPVEIGFPEASQRCTLQGESGDVFHVTVSHHRGKVVALVLDGACPEELSARLRAAMPDQVFRDSCD